MTHVPTEKEIASNSALQALQALVYEGEPEDVARNFKEQGNEIIRQKDVKNYANAVEFYRRALQQPCQDRTLHWQCRLNRAHVHLELGNNRSAMLDCLCLLKECVGQDMACQSLRTKALYRLIRAYLGMDKLQEAQSTLDFIRATLPADAWATFQCLQDTIDRRRSQLETMAREKERHMAQKTDEQHRLIRVLLDRGYHLAGDDEELVFQEYFLPAVDSPARLMSLPSSFPYRVQWSPEDEVVLWPVLLIFPQVEQVDTVAEWPDQVRLKDMLLTLETEMPLDWDQEGAYQTCRVALYYPVVGGGAGTVTKRYNRLPILSTLLACLSNPAHKVPEDGVIRLWVVPKPDGNGAAAAWTRKWLRKSGNE